MYCVDYTCRVNPTCGIGVRSVGSRTGAVLWPSRTWHACTHVSLTLHSYILFLLYPISSLLGISDTSADVYFWNPHIHCRILFWLWTTKPMYIFTLSLYWIRRRNEIQWWKRMISYVFDCRKTNNNKTNYMFCFRKITPPYSKLLFKYSQHWMKGS